MTIYQCQLWWRLVFGNCIFPSCKRRMRSSSNIKWIPCVRDAATSCILLGSKKREVVKASMNLNRLGARLSLQLVSSLQPAHNMLPFSDKSRHTFYSQQAMKLRGLTHLKGFSDLFIHWSSITDCFTAEMLHFTNTGWLAPRCRTTVKKTSQRKILD